MHFKLLTLGLIASFASTAQTDIWVLDINQQQLDVSSAKNITAREGYDNQPYFSQDGHGLYYTKMLNQYGTTQADIFYYDFKSKSHSNITRTIQTSEYSPIETPSDTSTLSVIKVETDGVQRLWTVNSKTGQQQMLNRDVQPVGYHAWGKNSDLTTFVLGEPMTLQYLSVFDSKQAKKVDSEIGRSIRYNAKKDWFSYSKGNEEQQVVWKFDATTNKTNELIPLPARSQYYTWLNESTLISADSAMLKTWKIDSENGWQNYQDLASICPKGISRIAVNKSQTKIALVCDE